MKNFIRILVIAVALIALVTVISISSRDKSAKRETPPLTADLTALERALPVVGIRLEPTDFLEVIMATGVLEAWNRTMVSSETGGRVVGWNADIGQHLNKGQVIISFDDEVAELQWRQAEAALETAHIAAEKAQKDFKRQQSLHAKGDLSDNIIESAELTMKNAGVNLKAVEASAGLARRAYDETKVRMPFTGRLSAKLVVVGQSVPPGSPVAEVVQTNPIKITVGLSEMDIVRIDPGQEVKIMTGGWGERTFIGRVHAVGAAADIATRLFPVEIAVPNRDMAIKPGMAASVEIVIKAHLNALVIPQDAVKDYGEKINCYIAEGDRAVLRTVEISQPHSGMVMLLDGASPGDTVITIGIETIRPGQKLTVSLEDER
ncbi:efflux RND transporter periplasmic adaptor subunit [bacterium]|nr:efflux RND transporter periplasmic adaptor subunit [bacterium]